MQGATGTAGLHLFAINPSATYYTYPQTASAFYASQPTFAAGQGAAYYSGGGTNQFATMNTYTDPINGNPNAIGLDVDIACGQCHGGGSGNGTNPYGIKVPSPAPPTFSRTFLAQAAMNIHNLSTIETSETPVLTPAAGTYYATQSVTLSAQTNAAIYYTLDGTTPTNASTLYTGAISVPATKTIKAIAYGPTGFLTSAVASGTYTISATGTVATPAISPAAGAFEQPFVATFSDATPGASICYTTDGTTPGVSAGVCTGTGTLYAAPFTVTPGQTVKAIGFESAWTEQRGSNQRLPCCHHSDPDVLHLGWPVQLHPVALPAGPDAERDHLLHDRYRHRHSGYPGCERRWHGNPVLQDRYAVQRPDLDSDRLGNLGHGDCSRSEPIGQRCHLQDELQRHHSDSVVQHAEHRKLQRKPEHHCFRSGFLRDYLLPDAGGHHGWNCTHGTCRYQRILQRRLGRLDESAGCSGEREGLHLRVRSGPGQQRLG